jgi:hypothetical protein
MAKAAGPALESSETKPDAAGRRGPSSAVAAVERPASYRLEVSEFCASVRTGRPLRCGPDKAIGSAVACLAAHKAIESKSRVELT